MPANALLLDYGDGSGELEVPVDANGQSFVINRTYTQTGIMLLRVRVTNDDGRSTSQMVSLNVQAAPGPKLVSVSIGDRTSQRSIVTQVAVQFDGLIDFSSAAFRVKNRATQQYVTTTAVGTDNNGRTEVVLRFSGAGTRTGTNGLADGNYELEVNGSLVSVRGTSRNLDGDGDGIAGGIYRFGHLATDQFFAFFGDLDGDRDVDALDNSAFTLARNSRRGHLHIRPRSMSMATAMSTRSILWHSEPT